MSLESFNRLMKLAAEAFYGDKAENQRKSGKIHNRGMYSVVLHALTRRQWVREEDLAMDLHMSFKKLLQILRFFEEERFVTRDYRREGAAVFSAAVAATGNKRKFLEEGVEKIKMHKYSYCCLDYSQVFDVLRYKVHRMKTILMEEELENCTIRQLEAQIYSCLGCGKRYDAYDAGKLVSLEDNENFQCEDCDGVLIVAANEAEIARKARHLKSVDHLQKMKVQFKPLMDQIEEVTNLTPPEFIGLEAWMALRNHTVGEDHTAYTSEQNIDNTEIVDAGNVECSGNESSVEWDDDATHLFYEGMRAYNKELEDMLYLFPGMTLDDLFTKYFIEELNNPLQMESVTRMDTHELSEFISEHKK